MTIPEALKELYVALGGDADDVANMSTNPELIAKIATIAGGGSGLPEVTAADNGDVLAVVDGAWGKSVPKYVYNLVAKGGGKWELPSGVTCADVFSLIRDGKDVVLVQAAGGFARYYSVLSIEGTKAYASCLGKNGTNFKIQACEITNDASTAEVATSYMEFT